jgi:hypothetical protein
MFQNTCTRTPGFGQFTLLYSAFLALLNKFLFYFLFGTNSKNPSAYNNAQLPSIFLDHSGCAHAAPGYRSVSGEDTLPPTLT